MRYSTEPTDGLYVESCRFLSFIKNMANKNDKRMGKNVTKI